MEDGFYDSTQGRRVKVVGRANKGKDGCATLFVVRRQLISELVSQNPNASAEYVLEELYDKYGDNNEQRKRIQGKRRNAMKNKRALYPW